MLPLKMTHEVGVIRQKRPTYVEWEIENFFSYTKKDGTVLWSPDFYLADETSWCLGISMDRNEDNGKEYVTLFLFKWESDKEYEIACKMGILKCDGSEMNVKGAYHKFTKKDDCAEIDKFCKSSDIEKWKDGISRNGAVIFFCDIYIIGNSDVTCKTYPSKYFDVLIQNYKSLYLEGRLSDVTITVKEKDFKAHKTVLAAHSPVFAAMFEHNMVEKSSNRVDITDCDPASFHEFLLFLYTGKLEDVSPSKSFSLYETANKYDVKELKKECVNLMERTFSIDTFTDAVTLATDYEETELLERAIEFFIENTADIIRSAKWQSFMAEYTTVASELFFKFVNSEKVKKKNEL